MAQNLSKLSALAVAKASKPGYYGDSGGLVLQVSSTILAPRRALRTQRLRAGRDPGHRFIRPVWGVELGKVLALRIIAEQAPHEAAPELSHDRLTNKLIRRYREAAEAVAGLRTASASTEGSVKP